MAAPPLLRDGAAEAKSHSTFAHVTMFPPAAAAAVRHTLAEVHDGRSNVPFSTVSDQIEWMFFYTYYVNDMKKGSLLTPSADVEGRYGGCPSSHPDY